MHGGSVDSQGLHSRRNPRALVWLDGPTWVDRRPSASVDCGKRMQMSTGHDIMESKDDTAPHASWSVTAVGPVGSPSQDRSVAGSEFRARDETGRIRPTPSDQSPHPSSASLADTVSGHLPILLGWSLPHAPERFACRTDHVPRAEPARNRPMQGGIIRAAMSM